MPFIVTTKRPDALDAAHHRLGIAAETSSRVVSRRAVATLEEARKATRRKLEPFLPGGVLKGDPAKWLNAAWSVPESGGTVGPLPDGTLIEVEPGPGQQDMRQQLRKWGFWMDTRDALDSTIEVAWTSAYNAREAGHA